MAASRHLGRARAWIWAILFGVALGGFPVLVYWVYCGQIDWLDGIVFLDLILVGTGFAQMALAASLMHDSLIAANPVTVLAAIFRIGSGLRRPLPGAALRWCWLAWASGGYYRMPKMWMEAVALWAFWVFVLYEAMVVMRMLGLTYHAHSVELLWFRRRPLGDIPVPRPDLRQFVIAQKSLGSKAIMDGRAWPFGSFSCDLSTSSRISLSISS